MRVNFCFLFLVCFLALPTKADDTNTSFLDLGCRNNEKAARVPEAFTSWFHVLCSEMGQVLILEGGQKGDQMVSKGGLSTLNIAPEMDVRKRSQLAKEFGGENLVFTNIEGVGLEGENAARLIELFEQVFPTYQPLGRSDVYAMKFVGYDLNLVSVLFLLVIDNVPQRAVFRDQGGKTTAWEMIDEAEWLKRAGQRGTELEAIIEDQ